MLVALMQVGVWILLAVTGLLYLVLRSLVLPVVVILSGLHAFTRGVIRAAWFFLRELLLYVSVERQHFELYWSTYADIWESDSKDEKERGLDKLHRHFSWFNIGLRIAFVVMLNLGLLAMAITAISSLLPSTSRVVTEPTASVVSRAPLNPVSIKSGAEVSPLPKEIPRIGPEQPQPDDFCDEAEPRLLETRTRASRPLEGLLP